MEFQIYTKKQRRDLPALSINTKVEDPSLYIPSDGLTNAVNVALALGQPLLLTGEPGTGKTRLADHIAWIFKLPEPLVFNAQTTSTARDLFYRYDAIGHFQYSQTHKEPLGADEIEAKYIKYEALGDAIRLNQRLVVLIDEVDKAPRDFPNDLLARIENLSFKVPEINKSYSASPDSKPIIIITSNSEKNLPDAFLRRVTYYHIPFPSPAILLEILQAKVEAFSDIKLNAIIDHFMELRTGKKIKFRKNPATAELIYWTLLLKKLSFDPELLADVSTLADNDKEKLLSSYSVLAKTREDLQQLRQLVFGAPTKSRR